MVNVNKYQKANGKYALGLRIKDELTTHYIYIILLLFWIVSSAASPFFRTMDTFANIFVVAVPLALIGLGQTLVV